MQCPKCKIEMKTGASSPLPPPSHVWAECPQCKLYANASTYRELENKLEQAEKQEITSSDVGKLEDVLGDIL